jgi:hypothetical protein
MNYAQKELDILVKNSPENDRPIIEEFIPEILALVEKFNKSGQSGGSAPYTASAISQAVKKLCLQQPILPITGIDEEWIEVDTDVYQNTRSSNIFKQGKNGKAYFLDAIVWQGEDDYDTFTGTINGITSRQYIKEFPFEPKTFYVDVIRDFDIDGLSNKDIIETGLGKYTYKFKDENQLKEVFDYYDKYTPPTKP